MVRCFPLHAPAGGLGSSSFFMHSSFLCFRSVAPPSPRPFPTLFLVATRHVSPVLTLVTAQVILRSELDLKTNPVSCNNRLFFLWNYAMVGEYRRTLIRPALSGRLTGCCGRIFS